MSKDPNVTVRCVGGNGLYPCGTEVLITEAYFDDAGGAYCEDHKSQAESAIRWRIKNSHDGDPDEAMLCGDFASEEEAERVATDHFGRCGPTCHLFVESYALTEPLAAHKAPALTRKEVMGDASA